MDKIYHVTLCRQFLDLVNSDEGALDIVHFHLSGSTNNFGYWSDNNPM
jgi:hypothetical protein